MNIAIDHLCNDYLPINQAIKYLMIFHIIKSNTKSNIGSVTGLSEDEGHYKLPMYNAFLYCYTHI